MEALNDLRQDIDALDAQLAALYRRRMDVAARIAAVKQEQGLPVLQPEREQEIRARLAELAAPALQPAGRAPAPQLFPGNSRHARRVFL